MRIALGQFNALVGDLAGNAEKMRKIHAQALHSDIDLLVFPEMAICSYPPEDLLCKDHFKEDCRFFLEKLASDCPGITIVVGFVEGSGCQTYNSAAVLQNGEVKEIYRKGRLINTGVFDEKRYFDPGLEPVVINVKGINIALTICFDIWDADWLTDFLKDAGKIDLIVNLSASPFHVGKSQQRKAWHRF